MQLKIKNERINPYMKRKEIIIEAVHEGTPTPSKQAVQELVTKQFGYNPELTEVRAVTTQGGAGRSEIKLFIWNEKKPEPKKKKEKKKKSKK